MVQEPTCGRRFCSVPKCIASGLLKKASAQQQRGVADIRRNQSIEAVRDEALQCGGRASIVVIGRPGGLPCQQGCCGTAREREGQSARAGYGIQGQYDAAYTQCM